jgi:hypothetical protein
MGLFAKHQRILVHANWQLRDQDAYPSGRLCWQTIGQPAGSDSGWQRAGHCDRASGPPGPGGDSDRDGGTELPPTPAHRCVRILCVAVNRFGALLCWAGVYESPAEICEKTPKNQNTRRDTVWHTIQNQSRKTHGKETTKAKAKQSNTRLIAHNIFLCLDSIQGPAVSDLLDVIHYSAPCCDGQVDNMLSSILDFCLSIEDLRLENKESNIVVKPYVAGEEALASACMFLGA